MTVTSHRAVRGGRGSGLPPAGAARAPRRRRGPPRPVRGRPRGAQGPAALPGRRRGAPRVLRAGHLPPSPVGAVPGAAVPEKRAVSLSDRGWGAQNAAQLPGGWEGDSPAPAFGSHLRQLRTLLAILLTCQLPTPDGDARPLPPQYKHAEGRWHQEPRPGPMCCQGSTAAGSSPQQQPQLHLHASSTTGIPQRFPRRERGSAAET